MGCGSKMPTSTKTWHPSAQAGPNYRHPNRIGLGERLLRRCTKEYLKQYSHPVPAATPICRAVFLGYWISTNIILDGIYEGSQLDALARFAFRQLDRATTALDIGANIGNHTVYLAGYFSRVVAFEPNPRVADLLRANVMGLEGTVDVVSLGLSDKPGTLNIAIHEGNLGGSRVTRGPGDTTTEVKTLDSLTTSHDLHNILFIKIDVEEHKDWVIAGAGAPLREHQPVIALEGFYAMDPARGHRVSRLLADRGYRYYFGLPDTKRRADRFIPRPLRRKRPLWYEPIATLNGADHDLAIVVTRPLDWRR